MAFDSSSSHCKPSLPCKTLKPAGEFLPCPAAENFLQHLHEASTSAAIQRCGGSVSCWHFPQGLLQASQKQNQNEFCSPGAVCSCLETGRSRGELGSGRWRHGRALGAASAAPREGEGLKVSPATGSPLLGLSAYGWVRRWSLHIFTTCGHPVLNLPLGTVFFSKPGINVPI